MLSKKEKYKVIWSDGVIMEKKKIRSRKIAANLDGSCGEKVYQYMINILRQQN